MSAKINIWSIVTGHVMTLKDSSSGKVSIIDYITFYVVPVTIAVLFSVFGIIVSEGANSLLVNFGAIFTALLLSVLVLVYDQGEKLRGINDKDKSNIIELKQQMLEQLYFNICYAIVLAVFMVFLCLIYTFLPEKACLISLGKISFSFDIKMYLASPLILTVVLNLLLTILMVVKRMHTLLTIRI